MWRLDGRHLYRAAGRLLICADSGGSNGPKLRAWKLGLQTLADELAMPITVCHYPPGTSKWNKIEHRLFSFISLNWRGRPLVNYETVVNLIVGTFGASGPPTPRARRPTSRAPTASRPPPLGESR